MIVNYSFGSEESKFWGKIDSMDKAYEHQKYEAEIYKMWEESGAFEPIEKGVPYTVLMPPPNANASLHAGHAMYTIDDIMIRWKRMQGFSAVWIPGRDHAGFETQFVYEKKLAKEGKSRLDFDRKTLYENVFKFVEENSNLIFSQFRRLGLSADWSRAVFTLDVTVLLRVFETFKQMEKEGKVYRDEYLVNYCNHCGTSLSELEVDHVERTDKLYYIKYGLLTVATVRPETMFGDTAVAINPKDVRYKNLVGKTVKLPLTTREIPIIADEMVDMEFGTGAVKITPAHDPNDFAAGNKHNLKNISVIDLNGRMKLPEDALVPDIEGKKVKEAREMTVSKLEELGLLEKVNENYLHSVTVCYKCGRDLEPTITPNWFIKVEELKKPVIEATNQELTKFFPKRFKKQMLDWLKVMHDWPISRQIVWGIRIPVWYEVNENSENVWVGWLDSEKKFNQGTLKNELCKSNLENIETGLQWVRAATGAEQPKYVVSNEKPEGGNWLPETDTFDTWFSSGQWPLVTLKPEEFETRLPTDFIGTLEDILPFWISRMMMFSLYVKNKVPYKQVYLWSKVTDAKGQKMSKSKGNVVNPVEFIDKYGADAVRMALVFGVAPGSSIPFSEEKIRGMRNFANKVWNMGRFIQMMFAEYDKGVPRRFSEVDSLNVDDKEIIKKFNAVVKRVNGGLEKLRFSDAAEEIYEFMWHEVADVYIEKIKDRKNDEAALSTIKHVYLNCLKLLHPIMPFVTETIWREFMEEAKIGMRPGMLIKAKWPEII
jgi:valyl-tRNA synthetase